MADCSDVEKALLSGVTTAMFPQGIGFVSAIGNGVRIYRGWPVTAALEADRIAGIVNISVFSVIGSARNTTRWGTQEVEPTATPSLTATIRGNSASFNGDAAAGQLAGLLIGDKAYVHRTVAQESPAMVAAALADAVRANQICWLTGTTVTVPGISEIVARTSSDAAVVTETQRQVESFRLSVWAPTPTLRDIVGGLVCSAFSQISFLMLADGTSGRMRYKSGEILDGDRDASVYRRDLIYDVEYATTVLTKLPSMLFGDLELNGNPTLV